MSAIRVLHLVDSLEPGGMENGVVNVAVRLNPERFDIHACCLTRKGEFAERMPQPRQVSSIGKRDGFSKQWVTAVKRKIKQVQPDLLHTHNLGPLIYGALATGFGRRVPLLHGEHGQLDRHHLSAKRLWQRRVLYRACRQVHTVSQSLRQDLIGCGFAAGKITAITNGVDTGRFYVSKDKVMSRQALGLGLSEQSKLLGMVGRFSEFKEHGLLLDAFERLCDQGEDLHLLLIGAGGSEEEKVLRRVRGSAFANRIHALGHQVAPEVYYQAMDLMVFPSSHEGLSNAVLESMSCGVPVLASEACGNDEVIVNGENGFLEKFESEEILSQAILRVLQDLPRLEEVAVAARKRITENFSIDSMVQGYEQLYRSIVE